MTILTKRDKLAYHEYVKSLVGTIYEYDLNYHRMMLQTWVSGTKDGRWTQKQIDRIDEICSNNCIESIFTGPTKLHIQCDLSELDEDDGLIQEGTTLKRYGRYLEVFKGRKVIRRNGEYILGAKS